MSEYVIITDSSCDVSPELLAQWEVPFVSLSVKFDEDAESFANFDMPFDRFYDRMRKGSVARTSAVNLEDFKEAFEPWLRQGKDLLYIGFSSGLSTTVNSGAMAAKELAEAYPERKILVVDSLAASAGFGLLLWLTVQESAGGQAWRRPPNSRRIPSSMCATGSPWTIWSTSSGAAGSAPRPALWAACWISSPFCTWTTRAI